MYVRNLPNPSRSEPRKHQSVVYKTLSMAANHTHVAAHIILDREDRIVYEASETFGVQNDFERMDISDEVLQTAINMTFATNAPLRRWSAA